MGELKTFEVVKLQKAFGIWALGCLHLSSRWARVSSVRDAGFEKSEDVMVCDR